MRFSSQQNLVVLLSGVMILVDLTALSGPLIEWNTGSTEERIFLWQLALYGLFAVAARWVFRAIWFEYREADWMQKLGWTPQNVFRDTWGARINRWGFHVDEHGRDKDTHVR